MLPDLPNSFVIKDPEGQHLSEDEREPAEDVRRMRLHSVGDFVIEDDDVESPGEAAKTARTVKRESTKTTFKGSRRILKSFLRACDAMIAEDSLQVPPELNAWFDDIRDASQDPPERKLGWPLTLALSLIGLGLGSGITWAVTLAPVSTVYMGLGLFSGIFGVARLQAEMAAMGGVLAKTLAWYLAPTIKSLDEVGRYVVSILLAAFLEYPFLTFANSIALKNKTAMRLRTIQDAVDVVASFIMVAVSGIGVVDVFTITQALLALLRVVIATWGPRYCLPAPKEDAAPPTKKRLSVHRRRRYLGRMVALYEKIVTGETNPVFKEWFDSRKQDLMQLPPLTTKDWIKAKFTLAALVCISLTVGGIVMGVIGFSLPNDAYVLGVAGILGMSLAWYVGPSLKDRSFMLKWVVSVVLTATLEYPFLTAANSRAAKTQTTFELRAVQDLVAIVTSTVLIMVLSHVRLNRVDVAQLAIGVFRVVVVTRFFYTL